MGGGWSGCDGKDIEVCCVFVAHVFAPEGRK